MPPLTIQQAYDQAVKFHQAGRLKEAEPLYRQILEKVPNQPDALHMLGVLSHQQGKHQIAAEMINRAIGANPNVASYHSNMGLALVTLNQKDQAIVAYQRALRLNPNYPEALNNLGIVYYSRQQFDQAISNYERALALRPDYLDALHNLGDALTASGKPQKAIECYRKAIASRPDWPDAYNNLGNACLAAGQVEAAIAAYRQALALNPNFPGAYINLGNAFLSQGKTREAIEFHRKAVALDPKKPEGHYNLGLALQKAGQIKDAIASVRKAIELRSDFSDFHTHLGDMLYINGEIDQSIEAFRKAMTLDPDEGVSYYNLGNALYGKGMLHESINQFRQSIALAPDFTMALNNLGNALKDCGQLDEALVCYRRATQLEPENPFSHRNQVYALVFHPDYNAQTILTEHQAWNDQHAKTVRQFIKPFENDPDPNRRIKIGYVSPDFREHVIGQNLLPLILNHDKKQFEVFLYHTLPHPDAVSGQFEAAADHWKSLLNLDDAQAAELIHADQLDILVDLALHLAGNRIPIFARKPAPIQVTFGGYPGGTGLETMDYRLSDPYLDPPEFDGHYVEKTVRLPHSFWCYDPVAMGVANDPPINELPALKNGFITFGCLNNFSKVNDGVLVRWAKVLAAVPDSRLLLMAPPGASRQRVTATLGECGIDASRIDFVDRQSRRKYFHEYHRIDIGLDTLPYNGHTTSLDSLWMGVPVVTLLGNTVVGRAGWSQMCNLKLQELAAKTDEEFVQIAVDLANDLPRLAKLRSGLRDIMLQSALTDSKGFARDIEAALRRMWQTWCNQQK
jgi:predicted O-linked N-acetylglucosamine transferase (SPINDLY family)